MVLSLLSKNEIAYLTGSKDFTVNQRQNIKYHLKQKVAKIRDEVASFRDLDSIEDKALVAQLAERGLVSTANGNDASSENNKSPKWDLNPRPKVFASPSLEYYNIPRSEGLRNLRRGKKAIQVP